MKYNLSGLENIVDSQLIKVSEARLSNSVLSDRRLMQKLAEGNTIMGDPESLGGALAQGAVYMVPVVGGVMTALDGGKKILNGNYWGGAWDLALGIGSTAADIFSFGSAGTLARGANMGVKTLNAANKASKFVNTANKAGKFVNTAGKVGKVVGIAPAATSLGRGVQRAANRLVYDYGLDRLFNYFDGPQEQQYQQQYMPNVEQARFTKEQFNNMLNSYSEQNNHRYAQIARRPTDQYIQSNPQTAQPQTQTTYNTPTTLGMHIR